MFYKDGMGRVQFHSKTELVWRDENEQDNGEMTFTKVSASEPEQPTSTAKQVKITASPVNVRSGAGTNYKKLGKTTKGKTYAYLASKKDSSGRVWYQIQYTSKTKGWVMGSLAKLISESTTVNPVKDYEGTYQYGRASLTVKATDKDSADIKVEWANSASKKPCGHSAVRLTQIPIASITAMASRRTITSSASSTYKVLLSVRSVLSRQRINSAYPSGFRRNPLVFPSTE